MDLDRFKELNDRHGHAIGDLILERAARRIEGALRETDLLFRWGGEEFVVLMPHTPASEVGAIAERVREALDRAPLLALPGGEEVAITASLGGAAAERPSRSTPASSCGAPTRPATKPSARAATGGARGRARGTLSDPRQWLTAGGVPGDDSRMLPRRRSNP